MLGVLALVSVLPTLRVPGFPWQVGAALVLVGAWRTLRGAGGQALAPWRVRVALRALAALAGFLVLAAMTRTLLPPLAGLLVLLAIGEAVLLAEAQSPFATFLTLLLSTTQVTGAAFVADDAAGLGLTVLALFALLAAALLFERRMSVEDMRPAGPGWRHVRAGDPAAVPVGAYVRALVGLSLFGFVVGGLLWVVTPRHLPFAGGARAGAAGDDGGDPGPDRGAGDRTGPDEGSKGIRLGDVGRIKLDLNPYFLMRLPPGRTPFLRENTYDVYRDGTWTSATGAGVRAPERIASAGGGWFDLGKPDDTLRGYDARILLVRGDIHRLYLQRDVVRLRVLRDGVPLATTLRRLDNEQVDSTSMLRVDDRIDLRVVPPVTDPAALVRARSDAGVAPRPSYLALPASCRPLVQVARRVVGSETNPWRRAVLLSSWLQGPDFTYTLEMPRVDSRTPVVDFVLSARRGHCEYFAAALTLMLRALGHPSRVVRGFRGGDQQEMARDTWVVRGSNYHAWTEMYLEGPGWIPLDPTPADMNAADATRTQAAENPEGPERAPEGDWLRRLLGFDPREVVRRVVASVSSWIAAPVSFLLSGPRPVFAAVILLFLLGLGSRARRSYVARHAPAGAHAPREPYREALRALASAGLVRRRAVTPREFLTEVTTWAPEARPDLLEVTKAHELVRYASRALDAGSTQAAWAHLERLRDVVAKRRKRRAERT